MNKYTSPEVQNECLQLMAVHILRDISANVVNSPRYSTMADEHTDCSNKERFKINIRWMDKELKEHEDFIGLYQMDTIEAEFLTSLSRHVLLRMNVKLTTCRGQCYNGATNMSGSRNRIAKQIMDEEKRALYTHCYVHTLNLAVLDTVKQSKVCKDALETAFEVTRLVKFSPKRNAAFEKICAGLQEVNPSPVGIRTFCQTRWTVRGTSLEAMIVNYSALNELWDECLEAPVRLEPDMKACIIGVKAMMSEFKFLYGLKLAETISNIMENLSKTLQKTSISCSRGSARCLSDGCHSSENAE